MDEQGAKGGITGCEGVTSAHGVGCKVSTKHEVEEVSPETFGEPGGCCHSGLHPPAWARQSRSMSGANQRLVRRVVWVEKGEGRQIKARGT